MDALQENILRRATIGDLVTRSARRFRGRTALLSGGREISFTELNNKSCYAANFFLSMGIGRGDRVAFFTHNCLEYIYCRLGLSKIGAAPVPLNFMLKPEEVAYIIKDSEPKAFFVEDSLIENILPVQEKLESVKHFGFFDFGKEIEKPEGWINAATFFGDTSNAEDPECIVDSDDMATLMYTTGTESFPKGVVTTHLNYFMSMFHLACDCDFKRDDVLIIDIPLFHVAGTTVLLAAITFGAKAIIEYAPNPVNILENTGKERVSMWIYPPTLYNALPTVPNFHEYDLSSLKKCISFGAVMPGAVLEKWKKIKPEIEWRNYWGQTESSPVGTTSSPEDFERKLNSIGIPDTGVTVKILDENDKEVEIGKEGQLSIRGPAVMKGYWNRDDLNEKVFANGWLHTGDMGYADEEGYIYFTDRIKDMIKSGGENVSSQEVEGCLLRHPKVAQAAVIGIPDPHWIEAVAAFVVTVEGAELTEDKLIEFCKEHLAAYKVPKKVFFRTSLPMSPTGKILKRLIKEKIHEEL